MTSLRSLPLSHIPPVATGSAGSESGPRAAESVLEARPTEHTIAQPAQAAQAARRSYRPPFLQFFTTPRPEPVAHPSLILDLAGVPFPAGIQPPTQEQVNTWLVRLNELSDQVSNRHGIGAGLHFHKPSSPRYQFAKHNMTAIERTQLTAVLMHHLSGTAPVNDASALTELFLCLQHARLRTHSPEERSKLRDDYVLLGFKQIASREMALTVSTMGLLSPVLVGDSILRSNKLRRDYYRSENRPEYADGFNDMMRLLRSTQVAQNIKLQIASTILDHYIRSEKLLTPTDANRILLAIGNDATRDYRADRASEYTGLSRLVFDGPSTQPQQQALISWVENSNSEIRHLSARNLRRQNNGLLRAQVREEQRARFLRGQNAIIEYLGHLYEEINTVRSSQEMAPLSVPDVKDLQILAQLPHFFEFHALLARARGDAENAHKNRKNEVYHNIALILDAVNQDKDFAKRVFHASVGGTQRCINNAMEYISELAAQSKNRILVGKIEREEIGLDEFKNICRQNFKLETLEEFIASIIVPSAIALQKARSIAASHLEAPEPKIRRTYEPEIGQSIKSDLREELGLPDTVNPSSATYPGKDATHGDFLRMAHQHVSRFTEDTNNFRAYLSVDPLWQEGLIALAKKNGLDRDVSILERFSLATIAECLEVGEEIVDAKSNPVRDAGLLHAFRCYDSLSEVHVPKTGQKVWGTGEGGKDKYKTEIPAFQDIYDRYDALGKQFESAVRDVKRRFVSYMSDCVLGPTATFPEDGGFSAQFALPREWHDELRKLTTLGTAVKLVEDSILLQKKTEEIHRAELALENYSGPFPDIKKKMQGFYSVPENFRQRYDLSLHQNEIETDDESAKKLAELRNDLMALAQLKNAKALVEADLMVDPNTADIVAESIDILEMEVKQLTEQLLSMHPKGSMEQLTSKMKKFYAEPKNAPREFDVDATEANATEVDTTTTAHVVPTERLSWREKLLQKARRSAKTSRTKRDVSGTTSAPKELNRPSAQSTSIDPRTRAALIELRNKLRSTRQFELEVLNAYKRISGKEVAPIERVSSSPGPQRIGINPSATAAIAVLDREFARSQLEDVAPGAATQIDKTLHGDFDVTTGQPTDAYVLGMMEHANAARPRLLNAGLTTGVASGLGNNCMIHSMLDCIGITGEANIAMAQSLRYDLFNRMAANGEVLGLDQYLDTFGAHPAHLIDLINEQFPDADIAVRIYTPLPGGGLHCVNQDAAGGTGNTSRANTVAIMWVGNHYEPIRTVD